MQALIDFDGWRKWKDFSQQTQTSPASVKMAGNNNNPSHDKVSGLPGTPKIGPSAGGANILPVSSRRDKMLSSVVGTMETGSHTSPSSGSETLDDEGGRMAIAAEA